MEKVRWLRWHIWSFNTCEHQGRVFNFAVDYQGEVVVGELFLGEEVEVKKVNMGVDCKRRSNDLACCPLGDKILVMAGERDATDFFCALVSIDPGELTQESIQIEEKRVSGWKKYGLGPHLAQIAENKVWASFLNSNEIWIGELKGDELAMKKHPDHLPMARGFGAPPLRLPDGKFLAAGGLPSSTEITIITPGEHFSFEKIGDMPGEGRCFVPTILIEERFVVGFGGQDYNDADEIWIFDLQTHKISSVPKGGKWHPATSWPFLAIKDGILYMVSGDYSIAIHSITIQHLSELIQDLDLQPVFQAALGLELRRYPADRTDSGEFRGMRDLCGCFPGYRPNNTVDQQGRVFHFSQCDRKLSVTEIFFGPRLKTRTVNTGVDCKTNHDGYISCCPLGDKILVMAGEWNATEFFCALVGIDLGELSRESIHVEQKRVGGLERWKVEAYLVQISDNKVWASFYDSNEIWIGELKGDELVMTKHPDHLPSLSPESSSSDPRTSEDSTPWPSSCDDGEEESNKEHDKETDCGEEHSDHLPARGGFGAPPLRLPDGRFLAAGGYSYSTDISLITPGKRFSFERIGDMPGEGRYCVSTTLIKERFLVGFGGWNDNEVDDMWIFDLQTHRASGVAKEGEWHPATRWPFLAINDDILYIVGGQTTASAHSIPLPTLASLIEDPVIRSSFLLTTLNFIGPLSTQIAKLQTIIDDPSFDTDARETAQLKLSLTETKQKLTISEQSLGEANSQIRSLTKERDQARKRINDLERRVSALREENERLKQNQVPPGVTVLQLPSRTLPSLSFPQKWMIDVPGLQKFNTGMGLHQDSLPHNRRFLQEYKKVFRPLLEESLPRRFFLARGAVSRIAARDQCSSQVSRSLEPGQLLPKGPLPAGMRPFPLRPEEKLLDSLEAEQVRLISREHDAIKRDVMEAAPPSYRFLVSFIKESDPLRRETRHTSIGRLRSTIQASRALHRIERARGVEEALKALSSAFEVSQGRNTR